MDFKSIMELVEMKVKANRDEWELLPIKQEGKDHSTAFAIWFMQSSRKEQEKCR